MKNVSMSLDSVNKLGEKKTKFHYVDDFLQIQSVFEVDSKVVTFSLWLKLHGNNVNSTSFGPVGRDS